MAYGDQHLTNPYLQEVYGGSLFKGDTAGVKAASLAANPNMFAEGVDEWGTPLSTQGGGLLGYRGNPELDALGKYSQTYQPGYEPVYGVKSVTVTDPNSQLFKTHQDVGDQLLLNQQKGGRFLPSAIVGISRALALAGLGAGAMGALGTGAAAGSGVTGMATGNAPSIGSSLLNSFSTKAALGGALQGGIGGLASGGSMSDALKGAALGGLTGGYGSSLGSALGITNPALLKGFTGALTGASGGIASGNAKNALTGALLGGAGGFAMGGGLGQAAGTSLDKLSGVEGLQGPTRGSGFIGALTKATGSLGLTGGGGASSLTGGGEGSMLSSALKAGAGLYSHGQNENTNDEIRRALEQAQGRAVGALSPYQQAGTQALGELQAGYTPEDLQNDPGYQFQLEQGQQALDRSLAAQGMSQSGAALKRAMEYSQGLADQTYNQGYNRWLQQQQPVATMGYGAASGIGDLYGDIGGIRANALMAGQQNQDQLLASLFGGGQSSLERILKGLVL